ncbi:unnamed protein product, partial [Meganyctiphanes norvegica]
AAPCYSPASIVCRPPSPTATPCLASCCCPLLPSLHEPSVPTLPSRAITGDFKPTYVTYGIQKDTKLKGFGLGTLHLASGTAVGAGMVAANMRRGSHASYGSSSSEEPITDSSDPGETSESDSNSEYHCDPTDPLPQLTETERLVVVGTNFPPLPSIDKLRTGASHKIGKNRIAGNSKSHSKKDGKYGNSSKSTQSHRTHTLHYNEYSDSGVSSSVKRYFIENILGFGGSAYEPYNQLKYMDQSNECSPMESSHSGYSQSYKSVSQVKSFRRGSSRSGSEPDGVSYSGSKTESERNGSLKSLSLVSSHHSQDCVENVEGEQVGDEVNEEEENNEEEELEDEEEMDDDNNDEEDDGDDCDDDTECNNDDDDCDDYDGDYYDDQGDDYDDDYDDDFDDYNDDYNDDCNDY